MAEVIGLDVVTVVVFHSISSNRKAPMPGAVFTFYKGL
jgi:hypothetical protein